MNVLLEDIEGLITYNNLNNLLNYKKITMDSRCVEKNDVFVAIKGNRLNGNDFAVDALERGASFVILDDRDAYRKVNGAKILVEDSLRALKSIGKQKLKQYKGKIIAITGSAGKTTTKELLSLILGVKYRVYKSYKNYNNLLGTYLNAANLDIESDFAIFEIATNSFGEIEQLSNYIRPDLAIITNIGFSHIGNFKNEDLLAREKLSIAKPDSVKTLWTEYNLYKRYRELINKDLSIFTFTNNYKDNAYIRLLDYYIKENHISYLVNISDYTFDFSLRHIYKQFVFDSLAPIGIAFNNQINKKDINNALSCFKALDGRGDIIKSGGIKIIDDTYNASFDSIVTSIDSLDEIENVNKIFVLGEMAEIDGYEDCLYNRLYEIVKNKKNISFVLVGNNYLKFRDLINVQYCDEKNRAISKVEGLLTHTKTTYIVIKASRRESFDTLIGPLKSLGEKVNVV
ncbi:MAG: UDP-N-acetylmuramoyl-tripeptide--D-alanyl-D-alanine ligase [Deferribacterota bacterium]|nr:UDP-N-acetylmuramoyl-tripeptide--D-alanyl-D-alanine ligase [Deferribacterota bacterium]